MVPIISNSIQGKSSWFFLHKQKSTVRDNVSSKAIDIKDCLKAPDNCLTQETKRQMLPFGTGFLDKKKTNN